MERFGALSFEEEQDRAALEAEDMASDLASEGATELAERVDARSRSLRRERERLKLTASTEQALQDLLGLADDSLAEDPKLAALTDELGAIRQAEPATNILVYTEYIDSQTTVLATLRQAVELGVLGGEVLAISGPDPEPVRTRITQRFAEEDDLILVSTDATAEGLISTNAAITSCISSFLTTPTDSNSATAASIATASVSRRGCATSTLPAPSRSGCCSC